VREVAGGREEMSDIKTLRDPPFTHWGEEEEKGE